MTGFETRLADAAATARLGTALAPELSQRGAVVFLQGELGTGKTSLVRAILQALGASSRVRSPTYTLIESYEIAGRAVFHLDLYRLTSPAEVEYLGLRDLDPEADLVLVEWPEHGGAHLPAPDLTLRLDYDRACGVEGRRASLTADSSWGTTILSGLAKKYPFI